MNTGAANVADLGLRQFHLLLRTGRVLLLGEVILAQTPMAIRAMSKRFFVTFMAAGGPRGTAAPRLQFTSLSQGLLFPLSLCRTTKASPYNRIR